MRRRTELLSLGGVALSSAAVLVFEIVLTRVFSVAQFYHFAFLTVSLALLGFGASGSVLAAFPGLGRGGPRRWASLALLQSAATLGAYLVTNHIPFDSFAIAWDRIQVVYLVAYYLALAVPFFFGGAVIGTLLAGSDQPVPLSSARVYAASLAGAGIGCVVAIGALPLLGGEGIITAAVVLAAAAAAAFARVGPAARTIPIAAAAVVSMTVALAVGWSGFALQLSPYKDLTSTLRYPGAAVVATTWESSARVDHVTSDGIRSVPGLSFGWAGSPPRQDGITFDGDDLSPVPLVEPAAADFATHVLNSIAFVLHPEGDALLLEPRGGLDVVVALAAGTGSVTAVESHGPAIAAARRAGSPAYSDPRVEVVVEEPRSFVERSARRFDIIDVALTAPYRPVTSGAYSLAEDYMLTTDAFAAYLDMLRPGGVLTVMRWLQTPPSETIRLLALATDAVHGAGGEPRAAVMALRGYATGLVLVKPDGFTADDVRIIARFAEQERFDVIVGPGIEPTNSFNVLPRDEYAELAARLLDEPEALLAEYDFDIVPPSDDRPFFTHFFRWAQAGEALDTLGHTWQPFGGAGFFVLLAMLALAIGSAVVLILGPLLVIDRGAGDASPRGVRLWAVAYFGLLGLAFLLVELPLVQQYILLVGRPTTALAVVLFALLAAAGAGSLYSPLLPWRPVAVLLAATAFVAPWLARGATTLLLPLPAPVRIIAGAIVLAPLGFLMGVMFPKGLAHLEATAPRLVPWAWGINGTASVIAAAAAALLTLTWGFRLVVAVGAACYAGTALLTRPKTKDPA